MGRPEGVHHVLAATLSHYQNSITSGNRRVSSTASVIPPDQGGTHCGAAKAYVSYLVKTGRWAVGTLFPKMNQLVTT